MKTINNNAFKGFALSVLLMLSISMMAQTNIAQNKSASQSSTGYGGSASRAVDGNTDGEWYGYSVTHTNQQSNPWWKVDFEATYDISKIKVFNRTDCCNPRLNGAKVYVGDSNTQNPDDFTLVGSLTSSENAQIFDNLSNKRGRYLLIYLPGGNKILSLAEVQVYGTVYVNTAPTAVDDEATTQVDNAVTIDVLANDSDAEGSELSISSVANPSNGVVVITSDDKLTYTPNSGYTGSDSFTYTVSDGELTATATVTLTVEAENIALNRTATQSSTYLNRQLAAASKAVDGSTYAGGGTTSPNFSTSATNFEDNPWWKVELDKKYTINNIKVYSRNSDTGLNGVKIYVGNSADDDSDDFQHVATLQGGQVFESFDIENVVGKYVFIQRTGSNVILQLTEVMVFGTEYLNTAPTAVDDEATTQVDNAVTIDVLANDSDAEGSELSISSVANPSNGVVVITSDDKLTYTPNSGYTGSDSFTYTVSDGELTATATVTLTVEAENIALNRTATQSSTYLNRQLAAASKAVDGSTYAGGGTTSPNFSTSATNFEDNPWWKVELDKKYTINNIKVYSRNSDTGLNGVKIYVGNSADDDSDDFQHVATLQGGQVFESFDIENVVGKYVFIQRTGSNVILQLTEVQVYGEEYMAAQTNIALNKSATQSSTVIGTASRAVDGNTNGHWGQSSVTHTSRQTNAWWRVDLEKSYKIDKIQVFNRTDCCSPRLNGAKIWVGNTASNNVSDYTYVGTLSSSSEVQTFENLNDVNGRYVMIRLESNNYLSLAEVQVYGELTDEDGDSSGGNIDFSQIALPDLKGFQSVRSLIRLQPYNTDSVLSREGTNLSFTDKDTWDINQLWWVVQDYQYDAFALVSADDGEQWIRLANDKFQLETNDKTVSIGYGEYIKSDYFFLFQNFKTDFGLYTTMYNIKEKDTKSYLTTNEQDGNVQMATLQASNDKDDFWYSVEKVKSFDDQYIPLPLASNDDHHTIEEEGVFTKVTPAEDAELNGNDKLLISGKGYSLSKNGNKKIFKILVDEDAEDTDIGFMDYQSAIHSKEAVKSSGRRQAMAGLKIKDDKWVAYSKFVEQELSDFTLTDTIYLGIEKDKMYLKQNDDSVTFSGVPVPILLNSANGNHFRMLISHTKGELKIAYDPNSGIMYNADYSGVDNLPYYSTNPVYSSVPSGSNKTANQFDWRTKEYTLRYKVGGEVIEETTQSPFYSSQTEFSAMAAKYSASGEYMGGEDFNHADGWELIKVDFGYANDGTEKEEAKLRNTPYMIMYNRFTGKLRVFVYVNNSTIANHLKLTLGFDLQNASNSDDYQAPNLWSSYLTGVAMDEGANKNSDYMKTTELKTASSSAFYYADFIMNYDPCVCEYESNISVRLDVVTEGTLKLVGRTLGGSVEAGSESIDDWLTNSDNFLAGVLDNDYSDNEVQMGDITFNNFNRWGQTEWENKASFVLPGKKVKAWERTALEMKYGAEVAMSTAEFTAGAGKLVKSAGKAVQVGQGIPFVGAAVGAAGKAMEAAGEAIEAASSFTKGSARAVRASAIKLHLDNLADEPDKNIAVSLPDPQPSVVFSDLAATGKITIETPVFNDVHITTPGSKNAESAPNEAVNGSKGAFPLYNEPLGNINMLYQPRVALTVLKDNENNEFDVNIRLKNQLYLTSASSFGHQQAFFFARYHVTTYKIIGNDAKPVGSSYSRQFLFYDPIKGKHFPGEMTISDLVDQEVLQYNIVNFASNSGPGQSYDQLIAEKMKEWIEISVEIDYSSYKELAENGQYNASIIKQSYDAINDDAFFKSIDNNNTKAEDVALEKFADYNYAMLEPWNENIIVGEYLDEFDTTIGDFCDGIYASNRNAPASQSNDSYLGSRLEGNGTKSDSIDFSVSAYPNPSKDVFNVEFVSKGTGTVNWLLTDMLGKTIVNHSDYAQSIGQSKTGKVTIPKNQPNGIYLLKILFENGSSYYIKLIKQD